MVALEESRYAGYMIDPSHRFHTQELPTGACHTGPASAVRGELSPHGRALPVLPSSPGMRPE